MSMRFEDISIINLQEAYTTAHSRAIVVDRSDLGMLKFSGQTRLDLINRMSTQQLIDLQAGQGAATVLTSDIGRIIDRLILYADKESVYCLTGEGHGANVAAYLRRFVFFRDDFTVEDLGDSTAVLAIYGQQAGQHLSAIFDEVDIPLHHWRRASLHGAFIYLHRTDAIAGDGYFVTCLQDDRAVLEQAVLEAGIAPASEAAFEYLRIESQVPRFGRELTLDYIPLEAGLWEDVSFNKGCYTGQEIIARLESRGRLAKRLVRLTADGPMTAGDELFAGGKSAGAITSAADGPAGPQALAYVKTAVLQGDAPLSAGDLTMKVAS